MLGYLSADIICSEKQTASTMSFKEQIMSQDKYQIISSPQVEAIMFIIFQILLATCAVLKTGEYSRWSCEVFRPIVCESAKTFEG